jgi:hypothetical protein
MEEDFEHSCGYLQIERTGKKISFPAADTADDVDDDDEVRDFVVATSAALKALGKPPSFAKIRIRDTVFMAFSCALAALQALQGAREDTGELELVLVDRGGFGKNDDNWAIGHEDDLLRFERLVRGAFVAGWRSVTFGLKDLDCGTVSAHALRAIALAPQLPSPAPVSIVIRDGKAMRHKVKTGRSAFVRELVAVAARADIDLQLTLGNVFVSSKTDHSMLLDAFAASPCLRELRIIGWEFEKANNEFIIEFIRMLGRGGAPRLARLVIDSLAVSDDYCLHWKIVKNIRKLTRAGIEFIVCSDTVGNEDSDKDSEEEPRAKRQRCE